MQRYSIDKLNNGKYRVNINGIESVVDTWKDAISLVEEDANNIEREE